MRKTVLLFFLLFHFTVNGQQQLEKIAANYFRSTPFNKEFSQFLAHLMNDPTLIDKTIKKKTDSTLFYIQATYSSHNPFFFKGIKTKVILAEKEEMPADSTQEPQSVYIYQLIGYAPSGEDGIKDIKEEYKKIGRRYKKSFYAADYFER